MKKISAICLFLLLGSTCAFAKTYYFYNGKQYGSDYSYEPITLLLNAGFDIYQCRDESARDIFKVPWRQSLSNITYNLSHPFDTIRNFGEREFVTQEVFPLSFNSNAKWWPNYQLHLIGGGVTYSYLEDWFTWHHYPAPKFYAFLSYWAYHFTNEIVENRRSQGLSQDAVADIYLFDLGGVLLFTSDKVRRFFSRTLNLADWSLQPVFMGKYLGLENAGQYFSLKWKFPFANNRHWHLFYYWGLNFVMGFSYKFDNGYAISFGAGIRTGSIKDQNRKTGAQTITYTYTGGIFIDRYNSLLASLIINVYYREAIQLNIYPRVIPVEGFSPGIFLSVSRYGYIKFGVIYNCGFTEKYYRYRSALWREQKIGVYDEWRELGDQFI